MTKLPKRDQAPLKRLKKAVVKKVAGTKLPSRMALVFDTETTGLVENRTLPLDRQPEIIEFYACLADLASGKIVRDVDLLIRPSRMPLPEKIVKITGITDDMLIGKPSFADVQLVVRAFLEQRAEMVIAHNASFDRDMVEIELQRLEAMVSWPRMVCTVEATVAMTGRRLTLSNLHQELFGEPFQGAHRARHDVAALLRCACELHKRDMI